MGILRRKLKLMRKLVKRNNKGNKVKKFPPNLIPGTLNPPVPTPNQPGRK